MTFAGLDEWRPSQGGAITRNLKIKGDNFMEKNETSEQVNGLFKYDKDTFRFHRFRILIDEDGIDGSIYVSKEFKTMPKRIVLENALASS